MELGKVMRTPPLGVSPESSVSQAVALMAEEGVGAVLIVDKQQHAVGIFTERDNLLRVTHLLRDPRTTLLKEVMTAPVKTAAPSEQVDEAMARMLHTGIRHLAVVDASQRAVGVVSLRLMMLHRLDEQQGNIETLSAYVEAGGPG